MARAGPYQSWRWRLGPARFGSYRKRHRFVSVSTARAVFHASGLGRCDGRHRLLFEYPIIFWTPCAPVHFLDNKRSVTWLNLRRAEAKPDRAGLIKEEYETQVGPKEAPRSTSRRRR